MFQKYLKKMFERVSIILTSSAEKWLMEDNLSADAAILCCFAKPLDSFIVTFKQETTSK
jgi:hypothetical protein